MQGITLHFWTRSLLVGVGRLELPRITPYASETYAYTNSATRPLGSFFVPRRGLEPPWVAPLAPKASAYTNFATSALRFTAAPIPLGVLGF